MKTQEITETRVSNERQGCRITMRLNRKSYRFMNLFGSKRNWRGTGKHVDKTNTPSYI